MGKSQARRLEQASMSFRKELRSRDCVVRTKAEVAKALAREAAAKARLSRKQEEKKLDAKMKRLLGDDYIPPRGKVTNKIANYGENKSQSKSARPTKRVRSKQMA